MSCIVYTPFVSCLRIAAGAHSRMIQLLKEGESKGARFQDTPQGQATIVVVFATIALESIIYNYAARKLGETYAKRHIDSMSLHTKWMVVPKLATNKQIPADHRGAELLQKLVKARNLIVHLKSTNIDGSRWPETEKRIQENNRLILDSAVTSFECIGLLGEALCVCDPNEEMGNFLANFTSTSKYRVIRKSMQEG